MTALHLSFWHNFRFQHCVGGARCNFFYYTFHFMEKEEKIMWCSQPSPSGHLSSVLDICPFFQQSLWSITTGSSNFFIKWKLFDNSLLLSTVVPLVLWQQTWCRISEAWMGCGRVKTNQERRLLLTEKQGREHEQELLHTHVSSGLGRDGTMLPLLLLPRKFTLLQAPQWYCMSSECSHSGRLESPLHSHFMMMMCLFTSSFFLFDLFQWFQMTPLEVNSFKWAPAQGLQAYRLSQCLGV